MILKPVELILQIHSLFEACLSHLCLQMLKEGSQEKKNAYNCLAFNEDSEIIF